MRTLTEMDVKLFYVMDEMKSLSRCRDKQVVCLIVDETDNIVSMGVNNVIECDRNCGDKVNRKCSVVHAEVEAVKHLKLITLNNGPKLGLRAYVNLFPCAPCQNVLDQYVEEIVTFGMAHKEWVSDKVALFRHPFYSGKPKQPELVSPIIDASSAQLAEAYFVAGEMVSTLQDQRLTFREELAKHRYLIARNVLLDRFGPEGLIAYTKSTYKN